MSDNREAFDRWVFDHALPSYPVRDPHSAWAAWKAATEQSSKEIERLNALVAMQAEALKDLLFAYENYSDINAESVVAAEKALSASSSTVAKWEAEHAAKVLEEAGQMFADNDDAVIVKNDVLRILNCKAKELRATKVKE